MKNAQTEKTAAACQKTPTQPQNWEDMSETAQDKWMRNNAELQAQHSPLPWMVWPNESKRDVYSTDGFRVATCLSKARTPSQSMMDAKLIVASVNHAGALAEALRACIKTLEIIYDNDGQPNCEETVRAIEALARWEAK